MRRTFQRRAVGVPVVDAELVHRRQGRVHDWAFDVVRSEGVAVLGFTEHAGDRLELGNVDEMVELEEEHAELMDGVSKSFDRCRWRWHAGLNAPYPRTDVARDTLEANILSCHRCRHRVGLLRRQVRNRGMTVSEPHVSWSRYSVSEPASGPTALRGDAHQS